MICPPLARYIFEIYKNLSIFSLNLLSFCWQFVWFLFKFIWVCEFCVSSFCLLAHLNPVGFLFFGARFLFRWFFSRIFVIEKNPMLKSLRAAANRWNIHIGVPPKYIQLPVCWFGPSARECVREKGSLSKTSTTKQYETASCHMVAGV